MQRALAMLSIVILLFMQASPSIALAIESTDNDRFKISAEDGSTQEETTIKIESFLEHDKLVIQLPSDSKFVASLTKELNDQSVEFSLKESKRLLELKWSDGGKQTASFVLTNLPNTDNKLKVQGIVEDEVDTEETHSFKVAAVNTEEKEDKQESDDKHESRENEQELDDKRKSEEDKQESDDKSESQEGKQNSDDKSAANKESQELKENDNSRNNDRSSAELTAEDDDEKLGDVNTYLGIAPVFDEALSGADANFKLTLKLTGSKRSYENVDITVNLPLTEHITFNNDQEELNNLAIDGVSPTFDSDTNQLTYHFDEIKRGQTYERIISLNTENGFIPDDTPVEVQASVSGEIHYTENDEKEEAQKGDVVPFEFEDDGSLVIKASGALSLSKFRVTESEQQYGDSSIVARGQEVLWKLELEIPKKDRGQLFLNPDEKITMTDTLPAELEYVEMQSGDGPTSVDNQTLTWEFDVDDFNIQEDKDKELYSTEIVIKTKVSDDAPKGELKNDAAASATFIEDIDVTDNASRGIRVAIDDPASGEIEGTVTVPTHLGPDPTANNGLGTNDNKNPRPEVTDDTILKFSHGIAPMNESFPDRDQYPSGNLGPAKNFIEFQTFYEIDQHLNLESMRAPGPFQFRPNNAYPSGEFFKEQPRYDIKARTDGSSSFQTLVEANDVIHGKAYTREELGIQPGQKVSEIKIEFLKGYMGNSNEVAPGGMQSTNTVLFEFSIDEGFTGTVENKFNVTGVNGNNERFNDREKNPNRYDNSTGSDISGPRQATVVEYNQQAEPVGRVGVKLLDDVQGVVTNGNNRMHVELVNVNNSGAPMNSTLETVVLLPPGVTLHDEVNPSYTNAQGENTDAASYEVLEEDYNGSGRQLVKVKWDDARMTKGQSLQAELDVYISDHAPNQLMFDVYGFSSDEGLQAPSNTGGGITDTVLQIDTEDLNGNGNTEQPRLKSGNIYSLTGKYDIQTEKLIKGPNDEEFSKFTLAPFDGMVDYKLKMTNTTGKDLSSMTLIDVLPTVGDLGITDNVNRGSTFDPILEGPIDLPAAWQDKVNVSYSTAKNPERNDLTRHTVYLPDAPQLTNPEGAEALNWVPASEVTDWSTIHSFKIELQPGDTWIKGQDIEIDFSMTMPSETDVEEEVKNIDLVPQQRAAWNSFAVATDQGHPVEPERVGVAIETFIDIPVEKVWQGEVQDEVTINLLADGEEVATIELSDDNDWTHVFEDLPTANGEEAVDYTIEEVSVDGYDTNITGSAEDGFVVTNTELTNIPVEKVWEGEAQDDVTINLLANGEEEATIELSAENDWIHVFENLPVANSDGTISYTVEEVEIDGYDTNITGNAEEGFVVTNTELINIPVEKVWEGEAQDEVTVNLLADDNEVRTIELSDENDWQHVFEDLPVANGQEAIDYTVEEVSIDGYDTNITGNAEEGFVVTNTELTNIPVEKVWEGEAQDDVTINLLADGEEEATIELSSENDWQHVFEDLPVANGQEAIDYTVEEVSVDGYDTNITGNAADGFVVTNTELTNIPVEKVWEGEAQDAVTINLLADGEEVATIELSSENDWEHVFEKFPVTDGEEAITYTVEEVEIDGYETNVTGNVEDGFVVTNTELTNIPVEKVWEGEAQDEITIHLLADGVEINTIELSAENDWQHVFEDLPVAKGTDTIAYTVEEVEIEGYDKTIICNAENGFVVTNTELMNIPVEKVWEGEAQDNVTINLLANGDEVDSVELSAENDWQHVFVNFPVAKGEERIAYTVEEVAIDGYETNITGNAEDGFVVTNTLNPPETPGVEKEVEDNEDEFTKDLVEKEREKEYKYNVNTVVPENLLGYEYITLQDELDERLDVLAAVALVDGEAVDYEVVIEDQLVTLRVEREQLEEIAGQTLTLQITAQIKAGVEVEVIDNQATIQVNENPREDSNKVPVIPPPVTPDIEKEVQNNDGEYGKNLVEKERGKDYNYRVNTVVPEDLSGYEHITLEDELDERLNVQDAVALVDGKEVDYKVVIKDQLVTLKVERKQLDGIAGQALTLQITAQIKNDVEVDVIDNDATIQVNNNPRKESNIVPVIPPEDPPTTPSIDKDVEGKDHLDVEYNKEYKYNVTTKLPSNIEKYKEFIITDELDEGLVVNADKVTATVDGEVYGGLKLTVDGNHVKVNVIDFTGLKGKGQIELVITAKIHPDTDLDHYKDNKIPNTADLRYTNESGQNDMIRTDPVTVTPKNPEKMEDPHGPEQPNKSGSKLPKTATNNFNLLLIGFATLIVGFGVLVYRKRLE